MATNSAEKLSNYTPRDTNTNDNRPATQQPRKKTVILKKRVNLFDNLVIEMRPVSLPCGNKSI